MAPEFRRGLDRIRDYLFGGGYPNPAQNAEQLSFFLGTVPAPGMSSPGSAAWTGG